MSEDRIVALEAEVRELRGLLEQSMSANGSSASGTVGAADAESRNGGAMSDGPVTRRTALRTAGVLAAGAIAGGVGMVASATPAAATTGSFQSDIYLAGILATNAAGTQSAIVVRSTGGIGVDIQGATSPLIVTATDTTASAVSITASAANSRGMLIEADSEGLLVRSLRATNGKAVIGRSTGDFSIGGQFFGNTGLMTHGSASATATDDGVGLVVSGGHAAVWFTDANLLQGAPATRSAYYRRGMVDFDSNGDLWVCTIAGTPGTWRKVAGPASSGTFHAIAPARVYDSRAASPSTGVIANAANRTVSVADKRDNTGSVTLANVVPAGATAVAANVTVTGTTGVNNFCINPGGDTTHPASTINWFASGQTLANGVVLTLNASRQVTIVAGSQGGSAHCIIDVTGYWL